MGFVSRKAVVLGAGLLGGSLGLAMRRHRLAEEIHVWSPSERTRAVCRESEWCDGVHPSPGDACKGADLVILCGPVDKTEPLMESIAPFCGPDCLITDVGSTKRKICEAGRKHFPADHPAVFIGSHPMAGSEKSGIAHASERLFEGRTCILTPESPAPRSLERLESFWRAIGMNLFRCSPEEHDRIVAHVSHLPHALAVALCVGLSRLPEEWMRCAGAGLRDTTRIAAGDPKLWTAIFRENEGAFRESLDHLAESIGALRASLDQPGNEDLLAILEAGCQFRLGLDDEDSFSIQSSPAP